MVWYGFCLPGNTCLSMVKVMLSFDGKANNPLKRRPKLTPFTKKVHYGFIILETELLIIKLIYNYKT